MEHQFYIDRLSAYFDNELKNEELVIVKEHVEECEECQKRLHELEKLENLITENSELSESDYWEQSAQKIESALSSQTEATIIPVGKSSKSSLWWKLTGVAASLVLVALFAFEQKDSNDELLRQEAPKVIIKHVDGDKAPIIKDTVIDNKISTGRVAVQSREPIVSFDGTDNNTKQEVPSAIKPTVDNLRTRAQTSQKLQQKKESNGVIMEKSSEKTTPIPVAEESQAKQKQKIKKTISISTAEESRSKQAEEIGKIHIRSKSDMEKSKAKDKYKTSSSLSAVLQEPKKVIPQDLKISEKADKTEINYWRRKVAEYTKQLKEQQNKKVRYMKKINKSIKAVADGYLVDREFTYRQLFEAYYKIAVMTTDTTEEKQAVQFLKENADALNSSKPAQALYFLEKYKNDKDKQKSSQHKK